MMPPSVLDALFRDARSHNGWLPVPVADETLLRLYEIVKWGPTSANCSPMRLVFVRTKAGRALLQPWLAPGNVDKTMTAPVTAVIGYDTAFHHTLPRLFPHRPALQNEFSGPQNAAHAELTALRNGTLQAGYFIIAARALGLDCGPMSGFDATGVDAAFWGGTTVRTNFLCNLGHGDASQLFARHPKLSFAEVCRFA
jgi:3-hydroxypropanoate dehydrogenase